MQSLSINVIRHFVETYAIWAYVFIIIGIIVEGEIAVILAGIFSHLGSLNIFTCFACVIVGGALKSVIGYSFGCYLQRKHSHRRFLGAVERRVQYFLPHFKERPFWSIFVSRFFILGVGFFTIIFSGYKRISLKIFAKAEALSLSIWSVGVLALGFFFSYTALSISRDVRKFLGIILLFFLAFFLLEKIIGFFIGIFEDFHESKREDKDLTPLEADK